MVASFVFSSPADFSAVQSHHLTALFFVFVAIY